MKDSLLRVGFVFRTSDMKIHFVVWQTTLNNYTKKFATRAARLLFLIQPMKSWLIHGGVFVTVAVFISY